MRALPVFAAIVALILGMLLMGGLADGLFFLPHGAFVLIGVLLIAGGITYLWKRTGFRGLKPK